LFFFAKNQKENHLPKYFHYGRSIESEIELYVKYFFKKI